ncbi:ankyrin repeat-containing domain protein [Tirmania nivea]|nr:ankyrin repeat-containing domain protein [Tirmania nivea]
MSFGYSVSDILVISKLAWDVYNVYKDAPDDFRNISDEIKSLHSIIDSNNLKAKLQDAKMTSEEQERFRGILQGCMNVLKDLDRLLDWGKEDIPELRARLTSNTILLNMFVTNCAQATQEQIQNSQAEMQRTIGEIQTMLRKGLHRKNSTSSLASFAVSINSKKTWKQFFRDLHKARVTGNMIRERKDQIVNLFQRSNSPVVAEEVVGHKPQPGNLTTLERSYDPSEGANTGRQEQNQPFEIEQTPSTRPLLIAAAKSGDVNAVRLRLDVVGNIDYTDKDDRTALFWAAREGHLDVVKLLLEKGANIEAARSHGSTALYIAAEFSHLDAVALLLEKGANIEATISDGSTALWIAAQNGHFEVVKLLLEKSANMEATASNGITALYIAAQNGHFEVVKLLLENSANMEAAASNGETPLWIAAQNGHSEVVKLLLENSANLEAPRSDGITALYMAAYNGHTEVVKVLLEKGANRGVIDN